jgi:hypothetical protein
MVNGRRIAALVLVVFMMSGCSQYQTVLRPPDIDLTGYDTIVLGTITGSHADRLREELSGLLADSGYFRTVSAGGSASSSGDVVVTGEVMQYDLYGDKDSQEISFLDFNGISYSYEVRGVIKVHLEARERRSGRVIVSRDYQGMGSQYETRSWSREKAPSSHQAYGELEGMIDQDLVLSRAIHDVARQFRNTVAPHEERVLVKEGLLDKAVDSALEKALK